ncbi:MAG TPA: transketolase [Dehalococcoidia bacterium]|nr:transketolase [Dehalococcoidia bacterium]
MTEDPDADLRTDARVLAHDSPPEDEHPAGDIDQLCINTIRTLAMDAVQKANSGHPGAPMGLAPLAYLLWTRYLKHNPRDPSWPDRDRFVLSAGHASMLLYALLYLTGYDLSLDDIKQFRQWGSRTPGHPERDLTPGVEVTTGPLGQGISNAVGMAIAEQMLAARFNRPGHETVDHYTYVIASDGDMMEGVSSEACSLAGFLGLGKLIVFYDDNRITIEGSTDLTFREKVGDRFRSYGWRAIQVDDGNDLEEIDNAIRVARDEQECPTLVVVRTHIAYGSPNKQDTAAAHGAPLGEEEVRLTKQNLGWPYQEPFTAPPEAVAECRRAVEKGEAAERAWRERMDKYAVEYADEAKEFQRVLSCRLPDGWQSALPVFIEGEKMATRAASGAVLNAVAGIIPELVGGSADLAPSNDTYLKGYNDVTAGDFSGRNFHFGVREHAMAAVLNGMTAHGGFRVYGGTFLVFSDYMRPSVRLAALEELPAVFVYSHDSIGLGEDGPTHQPVEHLASLRTIPNLLLLRPADANETAAAWRLALERNDGPTALVLTRQKLPVLRPGGAVDKGAYVMEDGSDVVLIGTGSEVTVCLEARKLLQEQGISARVVSMPSWELFREQSKEYRDEVLPAGVPRLAVEAATTFGWREWADDAIGIDHFGASAPGEVLFERFGFTPENVAQRARRVRRR